MSKFAAALILLLAVPARATKFGDAIDAALVEVGKLSMMKPGQTYTLSVNGNARSGQGDDFLRMREPDEILSSGLSSGCGDYAAAFYGLMRKAGAKDIIFIDSVQLTAYSLINRDDGHTGVAVRDPEIGRWVLVDPTNGRLLSYDWTPKAAQIYSGPAGRMWIWYAGRLENYPAKDHAGLRARYDAALKSVPPQVWERELVHLVFEKDSSLKNPRADAFIERYEKALSSLAASPKRKARVRLTDGGPGYTGSCERKAAGDWDCSVGHDSGMSPAFLSYIERRVASGD